MLETLWQGCYQDNWQDSIVPEAFCHPAKYSRGLIHRIYRYLIAEGHIADGMTVLDPFGGVALGALDAMTYGLNWLGVELEPKFVAFGKKNLELWRQRYGFRQGTLVQGDSRQLRAILQCTGVQAVVGSPPYAGVGMQESSPTIATPPRPGDVRQYPRKAPIREYGTTPGQLGAMPPGCVVGSPPYVESNQNYEHNYKWIKLKPEDANRIGSQGRAAYGTTPGQLGAMPPGAVVSSPPYEGSTNGDTRPFGGIHASAKRSEREQGGFFYGDYGTSPEQLGNTAGDTFWSASGQIMQELALLLPAGAVCAWVVKAYVKNKAIVPFPDQWLALCESHGFRLVEEIHASLVEDHGTQEGLFGESTQVRTEKKSFFRRLAEKKGSPRIDHETVLIVRKDGRGGGMCCVSSPPYAGSNQDYTSGWGYIDMEKRAAGDPGRYADASYGTTPGQLGAMPPGAVVSSPPFSVPGCQPPNMRAHAPVRQKWAAEPDRQDSYGTTPGNLGNLPVGRR